MAGEDGGTEVVHLSQADDLAGRAQAGEVLGRAYQGRDGHGVAVAHDVHGRAADRAAPGMAAHAADFAEDLLAPLDGDGDGASPSVPLLGEEEGGRRNGFFLGDLRGRFGICHWKGQGRRERDYNERTEFPHFFGLRLYKNNTPEKGIAAQAANYFLFAQGFIAAQGFPPQGFFAAHGFLAAQGFPPQGFFAAHGFPPHGFPPHGLPPPPPARAYMKLALW
jgi:hypothetical protein